MAINQCQTGVDDNSDIPPEMFDTERVRLGKKGCYTSFGLSFVYSMLFSAIYMLRNGLLFSPFASKQSES